MRPTWTTTKTRAASWPPVCASCRVKSSEGCGTREFPSRTTQLFDLVLTAPFAGQPDLRGRRQEQAAQLHLHDAALFGRQRRLQRCHMEQVSLPFPAVQSAVLVLTWLRAQLMQGCAASRTPRDRQDVPLQSSGPETRDPSVHSVRFNPRPCRPRLR